MTTSLLIVATLAALALVACGLARYILPTLAAVAALYLAACLALSI